MGYFQPLGSFHHFSVCCTTFLFYDQICHLWISVKYNMPGVSSSQVLVSYSWAVSSSDPCILTSWLGCIASLFIHPQLLILLILCLICIQFTRYSMFPYQSSCSYSFKAHLFVFPLFPISLQFHFLHKNLSSFIFCFL